MDEKIVKAALERSLVRMQESAIDLLQFHWWDYNDHRYIEALKHLTSFHRGGLLRNPPALTNFNTKILKRIVEEEGVSIVSNQVSFSILDRRPLSKGMVALCEKHDVKLLCYGTLLGGFFSEKWLQVPVLTQEHLTTTSLRKYSRFISQAGGWEVFLSLLKFLAGIATELRCSIPQLAMAYVLCQSQVSGVLIGQRLGVSSHHSDNKAVISDVLPRVSKEVIKRITTYCELKLVPLPGDCGDEYR
eukprot:TRINITY_DN519_c0_g1_i2.p1 TRINITY_DN519_c0_g1~~TRINITY_DN519_c0_g1_i2.p1  ORF type:complete len:245 (+),score=22.90 TRINITY_DN519_c0_g1_i2:439-1173(+)